MNLKNIVDTSKAITCGLLFTAGVIGTSYVAGQHIRNEWTYNKLIQNPELKEKLDLNKNGKIETAEINQFVKTYFDKI